MRRLVLLTLLSLAGCRGTVPQLNGPPEQGIASVLIGCRMTLPTGETRTGRVALNLEGEKGDGEVYRLPLRPQRSLLYQVEPGHYRLSPTRSLFGFHQSTMRVVIEGRAYKVPFPRDILRKPEIDIKPTKIVALGVLDVKLDARMPGRPPILKVTLDDTVETRRKLVQDKIRAMMDPSVPSEDRMNAIAWTKGLDQTLSQLLTEAERAPAYRPAP